jgi:hypothetical protein
MTPEEVKAAWGRKIFFLYPHSVLSDSLFMEILNNEYEVYVLKNHEAAMKAASIFPGSILFVNIDGVLPEKEWEAWIKRLIADPKAGQTKVGILTYNADQELAKKYLMEIAVPCGYIQLKQGLVESKRIILKTLEANEARGRRRYVRARCMNSQKSVFNVKLMGKLYTGVILDISAAGMTFTMDKPVVIKPNSLIQDIQLKLKGVLCRVSGVVVGEVREGSERNLLLFKQPLPSDTREKIHRFIFHSLQEEMDSIIGKTYISGAQQNEAKSTQ